MHKALSNAGITIERSPNVQKPREQTCNGKQKNKFAGAAKKNKANKIAHRSLVPVQTNELSDSDDNNQPEYGPMAIVGKPKHVSPRLINAMLVGITRHNPDSRRTSECDAFVDRVPGNDEFDAQMSNESVNEDLFGDQYVQKTLESRDVMDQQGSAHNYQQDEDSIPGLESYTNDSASDSDGNEYAAVESECSIVDETVRPSPMKMRTRSKA